MTVIEITLRLLIAVIVGGLIGYERAYKHRPAGIRTHILVCVGATIIALIQVQNSLDVIALAKADEALIPILTNDRTRLVAQVVSGIGFLGAGTIIVTKKSVQGLTTAASLWANACIGIAIGFGYYEIVFVGAVIIFSSLAILHKIIRMPTKKKIEIKYRHRVETKNFITEYFTDNNINIGDVDFKVDIVDGERIYCNYYIIDLPKGMDYPNIIEDLSIHDNIMRIRLLNI